MRIFLPLTVLAVILMTGATEAGAETYVSAGSGTLSCGSWTADRREYNTGGRVTQGSQEAQQESAWVLGFLSGIGFIHNNGDDPMDGVDSQGVWAWIDNYCKAHPIVSIADAAGAFYNAHPHR
jgi:hypothetical protein